MTSLPAPSEPDRPRAVSMEVVVHVHVNDPDVIERVTGPGGDVWRSQLYDLRTEQDVLNHLAYNAVANGVTRVNQLDGWGDMPASAATMEFGPVEPLV